MLTPLSLVSVHFATRLARSRPAPRPTPSPVLTLPSRYRCGHTCACACARALCQYCLPGVVDTWSALLYNLLASSRVQSAMGASPTTQRGGMGQRATVTPPRRRFWTANATEWLRGKGYAERFESCSYSPSRGLLGSCESRLQQQPWWAFRCAESRNRRAIFGADYAEQYTPWQPPELFA